MSPAGQNAAAARIRPTGRLLPTHDLAHGDPSLTGSF